MQKQATATVAVAVGATAVSVKWMPPPRAFLANACLTEEEIGTVQARYMAALGELVCVTYDANPIDDEPGVFDVVFYGENVPGNSFSSRDLQQLVHGELCLQVGQGLLVPAEKPVAVSS